LGARLIQGLSARDAGARAAHPRPRVSLLALLIYALIYSLVSELGAAELLGTQPLGIAGVS